MKPYWHCREFGDEGFVFVAVDQMQPDGTMVGLRHAINMVMFDLVPRPQDELLRAVEKLTWMLEQVQYPLLQIDDSGKVSMVRPLPDASRARAFGG